MRRPNGSGTLELHGNKWSVQYYENGKRIRRSFSHRQDAEVFMQRRFPEDANPATIAAQRPLKAPNDAVATVSELLVCADLINHGYDLYRAVNPHSHCDLVALGGNRSYRVEVKTGPLDPNNCTHVDTKRQRPYHDVVAIVTAFKGIVYRPPMPNLRPEATNEASKRVGEANNDPKAASE